MSKTATIAFTLLAASLFVSASPARAGAGIDFGTTAPTPADDAAIRTLLASYTAAVSAGDEARFKHLLLNDRIPFSGVGPTLTSSASKPFDDENFPTSIDRLSRAA